MFGDLLKGSRFKGPLLKEKRDGRKTFLLVVIGHMGLSVGCQWHCRA